jgi:hypothetical protein
MTKAHLRFEARQSRQTQPYASPGLSWGQRYSKTQHFARSALFRLAACYKSLLQFLGSNCELYFVIAKQFGGRNVV